MHIAGLQKNSMVDYPGQIAAVVFTPGCDLDCFYCHNRNLISGPTQQLDQDEVMAFLRKRVGLLDGVVISGGEPLLQPDLQLFIEKIKQMGYLVKLDTNAHHPDRLKQLLDSGLLDYIAADYKAPLDRYQEICGPSADPQKVEESYAILKESGVRYELRTTFIPQLDMDDILAMVARFAPIPIYALQAYRKPEQYKQEDYFRISVNPHLPSVVKQTADAAREYCDTIFVRQ